MTGHVVLLGDSIFDNIAYTRGEPGVAAHLQRLVPQGWGVTLLAVDGATTAGLPSQARRVPDDATHVVVSVGGNDALHNSDLLRQRVSSTAEALKMFAARVSAFEDAYRSALDPVIALRHPTTVCTIYNGNLPADEARIARIALMTFNDAILREAFARHLGVIDLRAVCSDPADYANPIEPSGRGGLKIARAIASAVGLREGAAAARVYTQ